MKRTLLLCTALVLAGCSGARSYVVAPNAKYPISLSDGLRRADGKLLAAQEKHVVGEFSFNFKSWGMFWTMITFTGDRDISAEVNQQIADAGGDGITNLTVWSGVCLWNVFTVVGLLPDCGNVEITGDIVKVSTSALANK